MDKLLWIDMEMTGLTVEKERILEVAAIVTDLEFNILDRYDSVVFQDKKFIKNMDEWNTRQHNESGLIAKIPQAPKQKKVENDLCTFVKKNFGDDRPVLCGNSIAQDRKFIDAYLHDLASLLHYRMLDVTSWKLLMGPLFNVVYEKKESHRALEDIEESIAELKTYIQFIKDK